MQSSSDEDEYDVSDPFVNDGSIAQEPEIALGLREEIGSKRKRKQTDRYYPIEQVDQGFASDTEDYQDYKPIKKSRRDNESEYEYNSDDVTAESDESDESDDSSED